MIGHQEASVGIYLTGVAFLFMCLMWPDPYVPFIIRFFLMLSIVLTLFGIGWINYMISFNGLQPCINRINPETHEVWIDIAANGLLTFKIAKKGAYGQTKGVVHGEKADVIDHGDFPIRLKNGNTGIVCYDMICRNVNIKEAVETKQLSKKHRVGGIIEAYQKAKEIEKTKETAHEG